MFVRKLNDVISPGRTAELNSEWFTNKTEIRTWRRKIGNKDQILGIIECSPGKGPSAEA